MSKGGGSTETNTVAEPWEGAQPVLRELLEGTTGAYRAGMFDVPSYPGTRVAPQSTMTQTAQQGFFDTATGPNPYASGAEYGFGQAMGGPNQPLGGLGTSREMLGAFGGGTPDLSGVHENILGSVVPQTAHLFGQSGMLDSTNAQDTVGRAAASALAPFDYGAYENAQNRSLQAYGQAAGMEQGAYEGARQRQMQALGMSPDLMRSRYMDPMMLASAGTEQDRFHQSLLDAAQGQWYEEANRPYDNLQRAASLAMGFGGMGGSQTSEQDAGGGGAMETIGSIMQIAGPIIGMAMMSDRRLKRDIRRIGRTAEGYAKYLFRYLWSDRWHIGVMAQEVPPRITLRGPGGFLMVDYSKVRL